MALLIRMALAALALGGCSLVLDPDELRAELATDVADTVDATTPDDTTDSAETVVETAPETVTTEIVVHYSGEAPTTCTFDYQVQPVTSCPKSCPNGAGWRVVVDASQSVGVGAFNWRFAATDGYSVKPTQASGPRVTWTIELPDCALLAGAEMGPGSIAVELATDGGTFLPRSAIRWSVRSVSAASCTSEGDCPGP